MTKPQDATSRGLKPHWKVRIHLPSGIIHTASWSEPDATPINDGEPPNAEWIDHPAYGDTLGYVDWGQVTALTSRWAE